jgi:hypothetical protein
VPLAAIPALKLSDSLETHKLRTLSTTSPINETLEKMKKCSYIKGSIYHTQSMKIQLKPLSTSGYG